MMKKIVVAIFFLVSSFLTNAQSDSIVHTIFLLGDAGVAEEKVSVVFDELLKQVKPIENKSTIVFLGDNIYPSGMPNKNEKDRKSAEDILQYQLNQLMQTKAKSYYIPGNHDWDDGNKNGLEHIKNQEQFIENTLKKYNAFIPDSACGNPTEIVINNSLVLIAIDTQWWLHPYEKGSNCAIKTNADVIKKLNLLLTKNKDKQVIVLGHHPLMSKGKHGGFFNLRNHIFPLTNIAKWAYLPLPIVGSLYPAYKSVFKNQQDVKHKKYKEMITELQRVFQQHQNIIYASGHDHNLQYFTTDNIHYIISGSAGKEEYVKKLKGPNFSSKQQGFFKLSYLKNGSIIVEVYGFKNRQKSATLLFKKVVNSKK